jgi:hypothetical protein
MSVLRPVGRSTVVLPRPRRRVKARKERARLVRGTRIGVPPTEPGRVRLAFHPGDPGLHPPWAGVAVRPGRRIDGVQPWPKDLHAAVDRPSMIIGDPGKRTPLGGIPGSSPGPDRPRWLRRVVLRTPREPTPASPRTGMGTPWSELRRQCRPPDAAIGAIHDMSVAPRVVVGVALRVPWRPVAGGCRTAPAGGCPKDGGCR